MEKLQQHQMKKSTLKLPLRTARLPHSGPPPHVASKCPKKHLPSLSPPSYSASVTEALRKRRKECTYLTWKKSVKPFGRYSGAPFFSPPSQRYASPFQVVNLRLSKDVIERVKKVPLADRGCWSRKTLACVNQMTRLSRSGAEQSMQKIRACDAKRTKAKLPSCCVSSLQVIPTKC